MRKVEELRRHALLAPPDAHGLVASVLAVAEQGVGYGAARSTTFNNILDTQNHDARPRGPA